MRLLPLLALLLFAGCMSGQHAERMASFDEPCPPPEREPEVVGGMQALQENVAYPVDARRAGIQGVVCVAFAVAPDGRAADVEATRPIHPLLDESAVEAVLASRFEPDPEAPDARYTVAITYRLR